MANQTNTDIGAEKTVGGTGPAPPPNQSSNRPSVGPGPTPDPALCVLQMLPDLAADGPARHALEAAAAVVGAGGRAIVAAAGGDLDIEFRRLGVPQARIKLDSANPLVMLSNIRKVTTLVRTENVRIVHAWTPRTARIGGAVCRRAGRPLVTGVTRPLAAGGPIFGRFRNALTTGARVIAVSDALAGQARQRLQTGHGNVEMIRPGIDLTRFEASRVSAERVIQLARRWQLPDDLPVVLCPEPFASAGGLRKLLTALAQIKALNYCGVFIGSPEWAAEGERLKAGIAQRGLSARAFVAERCDDLAAAYKLADLVVSLREEAAGFDWTIGEAQAMGCPVVAPASDSAREQGLVGRTLFLYPSGDTKAMSEALHHALSFDAAQREVLQRDALDLVRRSFNRDESARRIVTLYRDVLAQTRDARDTVAMAPA